MAWVLTLHLLFSQDEKVNSLLIISNYNMNDNKNYTAPGCSDLTSLLLTAAWNKLKASKGHIVLSFALRLKTPNLHLYWT